MKLTQNFGIYFWVRLKYAATYYHPPPSTTIQNMSTPDYKFHVFLIITCLSDIDQYEM